MGKREDILQALDAATPALRRYSRALSAGAGASVADDFVQVTLELVGNRVRARQLRGDDADDLRFAAYSALTDVAGRELRSGAAAAPSARHPAIVHGLAGLPFDDRAVLLLVSLEGFGYDAVARIVGVTRETALARLMRARASLGRVDLRPSGPSDGARRSGQHPHLRVVK